ncbi:hypothetical protein BU25DRAFT_4897 [Macroventuria anomochaeta]|uniref:Uncharacterized protein n=1 Tax=Macroventuria anomochaeta TaxID=301207 RepID=A0ACB6SGM6_9PLEO|nr:uncharacterized protein BU25DRAFT_4897 [Macroventuria anomochaeta]KAF2633391.1 hypothetical protein BU25DRAFT_4897 [Macroventuria anomochaeta]
MLLDASCKHPHTPITHVKEGHSYRSWSQMRAADENVQLFAGSRSHMTANDSHSSPHVLIESTDCTATISTTLPTSDLPLRSQTESVVRGIEYLIRSTINKQHQSRHDCGQDASSFALRHLQFSRHSISIALVASMGSHQSTSAPPPSDVV